MKTGPRDVGDVLARLRIARGFSAADVLAAKLARLNAWFSDQKLDAAVVGVSGGIDSALVLALLVAASKIDGSPLQHIVALLLPIDGRGATKQDEATARGRRVAEAMFRVLIGARAVTNSNVAAQKVAEIWEAPLGDALRSTIQAIERGAGGLAFDAWSEGQCLSVIRTPALYGAAALLQQHGRRSVVVGTTNRDEGAYLGFFGKASDGMVDVQPISDLHKSEVRALARHLGVPEDIIDAVPSGDVHDGRTDEEMIGASYDEVETFLRLREIGRDRDLEREGEDLERERDLERDRDLDRDRDLPSRRALEQLHAHNRHKYSVGSPAVHLDVMPRGVPGGWADQPFAGRDETRPPPGVLPGEWDPPATLTLEEAPTNPIAILPRAERIALPFTGAFAMSIHRALTVRDCEQLKEAMDRSGREEPVGVTGVRDGYGIGSTRATAWSPDLANALFQRIHSALPSVRFIDETRSSCFTDAFATPRANESPARADAPPKMRNERRAHGSWRLVGLSPILRFMRYARGGRHLCHYDAAYDYGDGRRTLCSVVFYLSDAQESGATRFVRDGQETLPPHERSYLDWDRDTREDEVILRVRPSRGDVLVFDHRLCHDVEAWNGPGDRVIVRADVVYEAIPPSPWRR